MELLDPDPVPDPTAADDPPAPPPPAPAKTSRSSGQLLLLAALIITALAGVALALLAFLFFISSPSRLLDAPQPEQRVVSRLDYGSGRNDTIGEEFDVPRGCSKVILHFEGEQLDKDVDVAFVDFDIYDRKNNDYAADNSGPHRLEPEGQGSDSLRLEPGATYFVETSAYNATWSYRINCE